MDKTFVSVLFLPHKKEERYQFEPLDKVFPLIKSSEIKSKEFFSKFGEELKYIMLQPDKSSQLGIVGQKLILDDGREFIRRVDIRYDDSKHGGMKSHLNLYLLTIYLNANKTKKHKLKQTHILFFKNKGIQTLHILLSDQVQV